MDLKDKPITAGCYVVAIRNSIVNRLDGTQGPAYIKGERFKVIKIEDTDWLSIKEVDERRRISNYMCDARNFKRITNTREVLSSDKFTFKSKSTREVFRV